MDRIIFIGVCSLLCVVIVSISAQTIDEKKDFRLVGQNASLPCPLLQTDEQYGGAVWTRDGQELVTIGTQGQLTPSNLYDTKRHDVETDRQLGLHILEMLDSGEYSCKILFMQSGNTDVQSRVIFHKLVVRGPPDPPLKPNLRDVTSSQATVLWDAHTKSNNSPIDAYILHLRECEPDPNDPKKGYREITVSNTTFELSIRELDPETCYTVTLSARNDVNISHPSFPSDKFYTLADDSNSTIGADFNTTTSTSTTTTSTTTTTTTNTSITGSTTETVLLPPAKAPYEFKGQGVSSTELKLTWKRPAPDLLLGDLEGYEINYGINSHDMKSLRLEDPDRTDIVLQGLRPYTLYEVSIKAYNSVGPGPVTTTTLQTHQGVPSKPRITHITHRMARSLYVHWEPPQVLNGQLVRYMLKWAHNGISKTRLIAGHLTNPMTAYITDLTPYTQYIIQVAAETKGGRGNFSDSYPALTDVEAPSAPRDLNFNITGSHSIRISWEEPDKFYRRIDSYIIKYWSDRGDDQNMIVGGDERKCVLDLRTNSRYFLKVAAITNILFRKGELVGDFTEPVIFVLGTYTTGGTEIFDRGSHQDYKGNSSSSDDVSPGIIAGAVIAVLVLLIVAAVIVGYRTYACRKCYQAAYLYLAVPSNGQSLQPTIINVEEPSEEKQYPDIAVNDFISHCDLMHADSDIAFAQEFDEINRASSSDKYACDSSNAPENRNKNRYINIVAYDHSRVILKTEMGRPRQSDYINANYVDGYRKPKAYIATQGPQPQTFADFWRMVWEENTSVVVMITNLMEKGRRKCDQYWPNDGMETYGNIHVKLITTVPRAHYTVRIFVLRNMKVKKRHSMKSAGERTVYHYHYTDWPDHGVPDYCLPVLSFVQKSATHSGPDSGPIIVHCSAGVGRTGTYILIDSMIAQITDKRSINVPGFTQHIRKQRNFLVQTEDQYIFIHSVLVEYLLGGGCTEVRQEHMSDYLTQLEQPPQNQLLPSLTKISVLDKQYKLATSYQASELDLTAALKPYNQEKNREGSILPVNIKRVLLPVRPGVEGSDFINASYLHGYKRSCEFVVTQHPTDDTMEDFWRMVWDRNSPVIVVLSPFDETEYKEFWPPKDSSIEVDAGNFRLAMKDQPFVSEDELTTTYEFILDSIQYDYTLMTRIMCVKDWPDSCPELHNTFDTITAAHSFINSNECGPVVVMDRYGGSTAGNFCALWTLRDQLLSEKCADFYQLAKLYNYKRPGVVGTEDDYLFLHKAITALCLQMQDESSGNSSPRHNHHNHFSNHLGGNNSNRRNGTLPRANTNGNNNSNAIPRSNTAEGSTISHSRNSSTAAAADQDGGYTEANDTATTPVKENGGKIETNM